jgi:hypothetical protein
MLMVLAAERAYTCGEPPAAATALCINGWNNGQIESATSPRDKN